jgi:hypothetical protein
MGVQILDFGFWIAAANLKLDEFGSAVKPGVALAGAFSQSPDHWSRCWAMGRSI